MPPDEVLQPFALSLTAHVFVFVLGTLFGSFANVCIYRWPERLSVVYPGSRCSSCMTDIAWYDNMPLISYFLLRGKCRHCEATFSPRYLFVEALVGILFVAAYHFAVVAAFPYDPLSLRMLRFLILASFLFVLVVVTFIDLDHFLILDKITIPGIALFYGLGLFLPERTYTDGLIGAAVGYGLPWSIGKLYELIRGRQGMGLGDSKFLAMVGALLGWQGVLASLFLGSMIGTVISLPLLLLTGPDGHTQLSDIEAEDAAAAAEAAEDAMETTAEPEQAGPASESSQPAGDSSELADRAGPGEEEREEEEREEEATLGQVVIPFGPFLALGAGVYAFVEPWLEISFTGM